MRMCVMVVLDTQTTLDTLHINTLCKNTGDSDGAGSLPDLDRFAVVPRGRVRFIDRADR